MWMDNSEMVRVGQIVFVVEIIREGRSYFGLRSTPLRTNKSHEPRLHGLCGETDNISRFARGIGVVTRLAGPYDDRARVRQLIGKSQSVALEKLGYPELDSGST